MGKRDYLDADAFNANRVAQRTELSAVAIKYWVASLRTDIRESNSYFPSHKPGFIGGVR